MFKRSIGSFDPEIKIPWSMNTLNANTDTNMNINPSTSMNDNTNQKNIYLNENDNSNLFDLDQDEFFKFDVFSDSDDLYNYPFVFNEIENIDMSNININTNNDNDSNNNIYTNDTDTVIETVTENNNNKNYNDQEEIEKREEMREKERSTGRTMINGSKKKVELSSKERSFKNFFYKIFCIKKSKFPKGLVIKIHNTICSSLNLQKVKREETRSIDLYFKKYSEDSEQILLYLHQHKELLLGLIPELKNLK